MATRMQQRRGTAAEWTLVNPILAVGEIGYETDTNSFKIGDGLNAWADLSYFQTLDGLGSSLDDYLPLAEKGEPDGVATLDSTGNVPLSQLGNVIDGAPEVLNTLNELAAAIGDNPDFLAGQVSKSGDTMTGDLILNADPTADLQAATKGYVDGVFDAEVVLRDAAISDAVSAAIGSEVVERDAAIASAIEVAIGEEVVARDAAIEDAVSFAITTEVSDRNSAIDAAISQEETDRAAAISTAINDHTLETVNVHGIADTADLATKDYVADDIAAHNLVTTNVHGIADTTELATKTYADDAVATHNADTTNVHGIADTSVLVTTSQLDTKQDKVTGVSDTEIGYLDGVTSSIQTQIDGKAATSHTHAISDVTDLTTTLAAKADLAGATFTGDVTVETNLVVDGNLTISGTTTTVNATDLVVTDPLIYIGEGNSANLVDLGLVSSFNDGTYQHSGIVRDSSAGKWKVFKGVTDEPTTTINFAQGSLDDLAVNNVEVAGVVFSDGTQTKQGVPSITTISAKTDSYTLSNLTERDTIIEISKSTATTLTIPTDATLNFPIGTTLDIIQTGSGQVTIAGAGGVTVNATPGLKLRTQWSSATLLKRAANTWLVFGDLSA